MTVFKAVLGTLAVLVIAVLLFVYSGLYNIGADHPHNPAVRWLLETTRTRSITARVDEVVVPAGIGSAERVRRGASAYAEMCQACHLAPGIDSTPLHKGLNPQPPKLGAEAARHAPERLFWIVKHGIKMSGMPAWGESHDDQALWDVVGFLSALPQMTPQQYRELAGQTDAAGHAGSSGHADSSGH